MRNIDSGRSSPAATPTLQGHVVPRSRVALSVLPYALRLTQHNDLKLSCGEIAPSKSYACPFLVCGSDVEEG